MSAIEVVTFDLWQTLIMDNRELGRARTRRRLEGALEALTDAGYDFSYEQLQDAYRRCFRACRVIHNQEKDVTFDEQVTMFIDNIDEGLSQRLDSQVGDRISWWYAEAFFDYPAPIVPEAYRMLEEVASMGYRLGMISNTGQTPGRLFRRYLAQLHILDFFQVLTFSDEVKLCKPSVEMFHMTLEALGTTPDRAVHLGDHIANDIVGGNRAGMKTVLLGTVESGDQIASDIVGGNRAGTAEAVAGPGEAEDSAATPHLQIQSLEEFPQVLGDSSLFT